MGLEDCVYHGRPRPGMLMGYVCIHKPIIFDPQGVVICVTSLVMALAQDNLDAYAMCYTKAVDRLHRVRILVLP